MSDREADMSRLAAREGQKESDESDEGGEDERERGQEPSQRAEGSEGPMDSEGAESASESVSERRVNVKDRESNLFMHLPQSLANDVDLACQSVNLTYQSESGEKLGKNRYLYPIVLMVGADNAVDLSFEEIQDLVERVDGVEDG